MRFFLPLIALFLIAPACRDSHGRKSPEPALAADSGYVWSLVLEHADWPESYNFQMFAHRDTLWVFHPEGNWFSVDGTEWTKSALPNAIYNLAFLKYLQFGDAIYGLGHFEGNIERFTFRPEIYRTADLKRWDTLSVGSNLPGRFFYHPFVFDGNMWIVGGEDQTTAYADLWNSPDGVAWTLQKDGLPFGRRSHSKVVEFEGVLYLLNNDVWTSSDGLNWSLLTPEIMPGEQIFGYEPVVFDGKIWLIGCSRNEQFTSNVLVSENGKDWREMDAPWSPRGGMAAAVFGGRLYVTGGKYGGTPDNPEFRYSNDLWALEKR